MEQEIVTSKSLVDNENFVIDYIDDDLVIIDNVSELVEPHPKRVAMNFIAACTKGRAQIHLNGSPVEVKEKQLLIAPPNIVLSDILVSPDFDFKAILISQRLIQSFLRDKISVWNQVLYISRMHVISMDDVDFFNKFYEMLRACIELSAGNPYRAEVIQSMFHGAFLGLCGVLKTMLSITTDTPATKSSDNIFKTFLERLNSSNIAHRPVSSFADELCITPKYLSFVCKKHSGKTANEWITEKITEEILYYLKKTDLSIKEIADKLGFSNPSFFGKYVKQHFGKTPIQVRQQ